MIRANVHMPYFRKFLFLALVLTGYAGWCGYDAWVAYPKQLEISKAYRALPDNSERSQQWTELTNENGWPSKVPSKSPKEMNELIGKQYFMAIACLIGTSFLLLKWFLARGSWIECDEVAIRNSRGKQFPLQNLSSIDKRKWEDKGIAVMQFKNNGGSDRFVLDDFKYNREACGQILAIAEKQLSNSVDSSQPPNKNASPVE